MGMHFIIDPRHRMSVCRLLYPTEGMGWNGMVSQEGTGAEVPGSRHRLRPVMSWSRCSRPEWFGSCMKYSEWLTARSRLLVGGPLQMWLGGLSFPHLGLA